jgi:hypothetical protein
MRYRSQPSSKRLLSAIVYPTRRGICQLCVNFQAAGRVGQL